jgi:hypothetical protein
MRKYEFFVCENPEQSMFDDELGDSYIIQVFPEDQNARDYDSIGMHSPDIAKVLNPIGIFAEDMECCFSYYPVRNEYIPQSYKEGLSVEQVTNYLTACGWIENKGFDFTY